jgi:WD40 repeat protein
LGCGQPPSTRPALTGHTDWVSSVAFSPEGNTLASGAGSGTGELRGISGTGGFQSSGETTTYTLDYTLDHQLG